MTSAASDGETVEICSTDGTKLCAQWWLTDSVDAPSVTVLVVHGVHQSGHLYRRGGTSTLVDRLCTMCLLSSVRLVRFLALDLEFQTKTKNQNTAFRWLMTLFMDL